MFTRIEQLDKFRVAIIPVINAISCQKEFIHRMGNGQKISCVRYHAICK